MKLLVRNLSRATTEHDLRTLFTQYGKVTTCNLVLDKESGQSKGFAFVEMPSKIESENAIKALNQANIDKSKIRVKHADA